jgi:hypothetical protein
VPEFELYQTLATIFPLKLCVVFCRYIYILFNLKLWGLFPNKKEKPLNVKMCLVSLNDRFPQCKSLLPMSDLGSKGSLCDADYISRGM